MSTQPLAGRNPYKDPDAEEVRGKRIGAWQGFVRDRDDPEKLGRVRIHIPALMGQDNKQEAWSDWAPNAFAGLAVPPQDAPVWVTFEQGFAHSPAYSWGWLKATPAPAAASGDPTWLDAAEASSTGTGVNISVTLPADPAKTTRPTYPYNKVFESEGGTTVELDDTPGRQRLRLRHPTGTTVLIDPDGTVQIRSEGGIDFDSRGDFQIRLREGASFKVVYPAGPSMVLGAAGFAVDSFAVQLGGRALICGIPDPIK